MDKIVTPLKVRERCLEYAARSTPFEFEDARWGSCLGHLNAAVRQLSPEGDDLANANRRLILAFLFQDEQRSLKPLSSVELSAQQKNAVYQWVGASPDPISGKWVPRHSFRAEANWILAVAQFFLALDAVSPVALGTRIKMYRTEAGINEDLVTSDYWLAAAVGLPGAVFTKMVDQVKTFNPKPLDPDDLAPAVSMVPVEKLSKEANNDTRTEDDDYVPL